MTDPIVRSCSLALALLLPACLPGSKSLGDDALGATSQADGASMEPMVEASVRWSTRIADVFAADVALAPDGSIYVLGRSGYDYPGGDAGAFENLWLGKFDASGRLQWEVDEPELEPEPDSESALAPTSITVDAAGDVYVTVIDFRGLEGGQNVVRKYDDAGEAQWSAVLPARARVVQALPGGGVVAGGLQGVQTNAQNVIAWAQAFDADGVPGWSRTFGDPAARGSEVVAAAIATDGALLLAGRMGVDPVSSRARAWVASVEPATGEPRWESLLSAGVGTGQIHDLGVTDDGIIVAIGHDADPWIKTLAADGSERSSWPLSTPAETRSLAVHADGSVAIAEVIPLDPEAGVGCWDLSGSCPTEVRIATLENDREVRWIDQHDDCRHAPHTLAMPDGSTLMVAGCDDEATDGLAMGLYVYEAQPEEG